MKTLLRLKLKYRSLSRNFKVRFVVYFPITLGLFFGLFFGYTSYAKEMKETRENVKQAELYSSMSNFSVKYGELLQKIRDAKNKYPDIDLAEEERLIESLKQAILKGDEEAVKRILEQLEKLLQTKIQAKEEDEAKKGEVSGKLSDTSGPIKKGAIQFNKDNQTVAVVESGEDGTFKTRVYADKYVVTVSVPGYNKFSQSFEVAAGQQHTLNIVLTKSSPVAVSQPVVVQNNSSAVDGNYQKTTVNTPVGNFTVHLMTFDLSQYEMRVDTAADGDCENNCPVKNLKDYVSQNGGVAGIHGTYFCPTAYESCAGKTNSFYYKLFNTRLQKQINWNTGLGENLPFLAVNGSSASYYSTWTGAAYAGMTAGISCRPKLVEGGEVVVVEAYLDSDKEKYSKISHGFIGIKGNTIYAGIVLSATVLDEAQVVKALGIENGFNIDGGGTSAMYYNGSYKVGPGRDMPNAVVFVRR